MDLNASFANRLTQRCRKVGSHLCVGFDPRPDRIPSELIAASSSETTAIADFGRAVIDLVGPLSAAIKFQSAFFEVFGTSGLQVMDELAAHAQACGLITIADIKRADIGSTAEAYARASLGTGHKNTAFDAITVNPWFGSDGVMPFFKRAATMGKGVFVLVRTSNPSSAELLELPLSESSGGGKVFERVAELVKEWGNSMRRSDEESPLVAAVVGATHAEELEHLRAMMPNTWFLVPGVGAQGRPWPMPPMPSTLKEAALLSPCRGGSPSLGVKARHQ